MSLICDWSYEQLMTQTCALFPHHILLYPDNTANFRNPLLPIIKIHLCVGSLSFKPMLLKASESNGFRCMQSS